MSDKTISLSADERCNVLTALFVWQQSLRQNLDRVRQAMAEVPEDAEWLDAHKIDSFDTVAALGVKLGGDPTEDLFGAIAVRHSDTDS